MKTLLKTNLTNIILIGIIIAMFFVIKGQYKKISIGNTNLKNMFIDGSRMLLLTKHQLNQTLDDNTKSIMDSMNNIKVRNVHTYTQVKYNIKDTTIISTEITYNTLKEKYAFLFESGCWKIGGFVNPKTNLINLDRRELNDTLDIFHYTAFDHKFWFIRWGRYDVAGAYSRCLSDTLAIDKFYKRR